MYLLIGAGGHAKVITEAIIANNENVCGFLDDHSKESELLGYPIRGKISDLPHVMREFSNVKVIISIGDNKVRRNIVDRLSPYKINYGKVIHPRACVSTSAVLMKAQS